MPDTLERTQNEASENQINAWEKDGLQVFISPGNGVRSDITSDAWGRAKSVSDYSAFHGLFTYDIPPQKWLKFDGTTEVQVSTRVYSENGGAVIKSGTVQNDVGFLRSKRSPRYQPNRWHLFSTALFLPAPTATGIRQFGITNTVSGAYFQLENGVLYAVVIDVWIEKYKQEIDISEAGLTASDLQYGHLYDVQFQWRGVGDYFFFVDQILVHKTSFLGTNTSLTIRNPAIPVGFRSVNTDGTEVSILVWCADVTSEWGVKNGLSYVSVANPTTKAVSTANHPVLAVRVATTIFGQLNTRDCHAYRAIGSSDQRSYIKAYSTRDPTALTGASFSTVMPGSVIEYDVSATALDTSKAQLLWSRRIEANSSSEIDLPTPTIDFEFTNGDYIVLTIERENPTQVANVVASIELGEEI